MTVRRSLLLAGGAPRVRVSAACEKNMAFPMIGSIIARLRDEARIARRREKVGRAMNFHRFKPAASLLS
jgi:hypothetical protein